MHGPCPPKCPLIEAKVSPFLEFLWLFPEFKEIKNLMAHKIYSDFSRIAQASFIGGFLEVIADFGSLEK